jgi:'Cold-shock' DNA-binding domain
MGRGLIEPDGGGKDVFVHVTSVADSSGQSGKTNAFGMLSASASAAVGAYPDQAPATRS